MEIFQATSRKRETYEVHVAYSALWECALGIAAITNTRLLNTLEKPRSDWRELRTSLSESLNDHLDYVEKNNTWKSLLQLLHYHECNTLDEFCATINLLQDTTFKFTCLPYTGEKFQHLRKKAAAGEENAILELKQITSDNSFFPQYIEFISKADTKKLKAHLIEVMTLWYEAVINPELERTNQILKADHESKKRMKKKMSPEELVQWATGGINSLPEPSIHKVLLIPQYVYRPWVIEADIEDTKVFYYPVANESLSPNDKYMPNHFLVLKHKALGEEVRLRIVKLLSEKDHSLQELTEQLNMGKTTIHHHLKILRAAKLVEIIEGKYALKANGLELLMKEMEQYLEQ